MDDEQLAALDATARGASPALYTILRKPTPLALEIAIARVGSQAALGKRFGITQQAVDRWKQHDYRIPMDYWEAVLRLAQPGELT